MHRTPLADRCPCASCAQRTLVDEDPIVLAARSLGRQAVAMRAEARAQIASARDVMSRLVREAATRRLRGASARAPDATARR